MPVSATQAADVSAETMREVYEQVRTPTTTGHMLPSRRSDCMKLVTFEAPSPFGLMSSRTFAGLGRRTLVRNGASVTLASRQLAVAASLMHAFHSAP